MTKLFKSAAFAGLLLTGAAQPVLAQSAPQVAGLAVANLDAVVVNSNAYKTAATQRQTTYKPQIDQAEARRAQITAQLKPLIDKFNADQRANPNNPSLAQQATSIQNIQTNGQQQLQEILRPVALSEAYVNEQISDKIDEAVKNAMNKGKISLLLNPSAVTAMNNGAYNLNQSILNELNTLIPNAQIVPPTGWLPREVREQQAAQAAQQAPAARPAQPSTGGR